MVVPSRKASFKDESILVLVLYAFLLAVGIFICVNIIQTHEEKTDVNLLQNTTQILGNKFSVQIEREDRQLVSLANILSYYENISSNQVVDVLTAFKNENISSSELCILLPQNVLIRHDGFMTNVNGIMSFEKESALGHHLSPRTVSSFYDYKEIVRHFVPIVKDGKTIAMLYAVIDLGVLNRAIRQESFLDDKSQLYIFDGESGDMLVDTWHQHLQNINILKSRTPDKEQSLDLLFKNIKEGKSGNYVFISKTNNEKFFFYYHPLGFDNLYIAMSRAESSVFSDARYIRKVLLTFIVFVAFISIVYLYFSFMGWKKNIRLIIEISSIDSTTKLYNRNRLVKETRHMQTNASCPSLVVYVDVNGLHEINNTQGHKAGDKMLRHVAIALKHNFHKDRIYRIGGDEFFVICKDNYEGRLASTISKIRENLRQNKYEIAVGYAYKNGFNNLSEMMSAADASMLEDKRLFYKAHNNDRRKSRNSKS